MSVRTDPVRSAAVDDAIRSRRTAKVLADPDRPLAVRGGFEPVVEELLAVAGCAPFHRPAHAAHRAALPALVPWRGYVLGAPACRALLAVLRRRELARGKIPGLLAAADALILVTWLPDPSNEEVPGLFAATVENMEHVAAAGAAVQNLLVAATARGLRSYWSSGGVLRTPELFAVLGVPERELLLGAIFLSDVRVEADVRVLGSKLADARGPVDGWARWILAPALT